MTEELKAIKHELEAQYGYIIRNQTSNSNALANMGDAKSSLNDKDAMIADPLSGQTVNSLRAAWKVKRQRIEDAKRQRAAAPEQQSGKQTMQNSQALENAAAAAASTAAPARQDTIAPPAVVAAAIKLGLHAAKDDSMAIGGTPTKAPDADNRNTAGGSLPTFA